MRFLLGLYEALKQCVSQVLTGTNNNRGEIDDLLRERDEEIEYLDRRREMLLRRRELRSRLAERYREHGNPR